MKMGLGDISYVAFGYGVYFEDTFNKTEDHVSRSSVVLSTTSLL